jgi:hypothetical protein
VRTHFEGKTIECIKKHQAEEGIHLEFRFTDGSTGMIIVPFSYKVKATFYRDEKDEKPLEVLL